MQSQRSASCPRKRNLRPGVRGASPSRVLACASTPTTARVRSGAQASVCVHELVFGAAGECRGYAAGARVGLTAGKVLGKAHDRNRIKRRMREVLRRHVDLLPAGFDLILHPRRSVLTLEFAKLEAEIVRILEQAAG